jgi:hypothetical protein
MADKVARPAGPEPMMLPTPCGYINLRDFLKAFIKDLYRWDITIPPIGEAPTTTKLTT